MEGIHDVMIRKLEEHTPLKREEILVIRSLPASTRAAAPGEDLIRQGEKPDASIVVLSGMLARYHTLKGGGRQYLSFHISGDWPEAQSLYLERMDHSVGAISAVSVALIPHRRIIALFEHMPTIGSAIWRETLIDAAIFRETITNNGKRETTARLAHFLCEQFYRAKAAGLVKDGACDLPLSQTQIADALASSLTGINRAMQALRKTQSFELRAGRLHIRNWRRLAEYGDFNPSYLHLRRPLRMP
jgi:CRP-like cAMP-binding protein